MFVVDCSFNRSNTGTVYSQLECLMVDGSDCIPYDGRVALGGGGGVEQCEGAEGQDDKGVAQLLVGHPRQVGRLYHCSGKQNWALIIYRE